MSAITRPEVTGPPRRMPPVALTPRVTGLPSIQMRTESPVHNRFPELPTVAMRFTHRRGVWEQCEERLAQEGAIEAGKAFWAAKLVEQ